MSTMNYLSYLVLYRICGCVLCLIQMCMCFSFEAVFKKPGHCLFFFFEWSFFLRIYYLLFGKKLCQNHEILLLIPTFFFNNTHRLPKVERGEKETFWKPVIFWRSVKKTSFFSCYQWKMIERFFTLEMSLCWAGVIWRPQVTFLVPSCRNPLQIRIIAKNNEKRISNT